MKHCACHTLRTLSAHSRTSHGSRTSRKMSWMRLSSWAAGAPGSTVSQYTPPAAPRASCNTTLPLTSTALCTLHTHIVSSESAASAASLAAPARSALPHLAQQRYVYCGDVTEGALSRCRRARRRRRCTRSTLTWRSSARRSLLLMAPRCAALLLSPAAGCRCRGRAEVRSRRYLIEN